MMYQRDCILTLSQHARESTGPDTLLDASEHPRSTVQSGTHNGARVHLTTGYRTHVYRVQFVSAVMQMCGSLAEVRARERDLATLPSSLSCALQSGSRSTRCGRAAFPCAHHTRSSNAEMRLGPPSALLGGGCFLGL